MIVESPAKAKTIAGYLGADYDVESSIGHIRDLPNRASDVPKEQRAKYGTMGVAIDSDFEPLYIVDADKKAKVSELKKKLKDADELLLATDEDREGEAIAWHLLQELKPKVPVRRMVFHEITRDAIQRALGETRDVDQRLVDAQETRRILDRLYGYEVSPVLWKKVMQGLSAGRVQSVAVRLVVERERERRAFVSAGYWDISGTFDPGSFEARLAALDGKRVAQGRDFTQQGELKSDDLARLDEAQARELAAELEGLTFAVRSADEKPYTRRPAAPFMTSTLQQEASRKLRYSSQTTMRVAQRLYENGYITYMRTDSTTLSESALTAARRQAVELYGADSIPEQPRRYSRKVKNAQEAHEAIRPAGDSFRTPKELERELNRDELALYDLIWKRTLASQMADARGLTVSLRLGTTTPTGRDAEFSASGTVITFRGFLAAYEESRDDDDGEGGGAPAPAPEAGRRAEGAPARAGGPRDHAALALHRGEPRPGARGARDRPAVHVRLDHRHDPRPRLRLQARHRARAVLPRLRGHRACSSSTSAASSTTPSPPRWRTTSTGSRPASRSGSTGCATSTSAANGDEGLHALVSDLSEIDARAVNSLPLGDSGIVLRVGRYGPYVERGEERASVPEDMAPDELTIEKAEELLSAPSGDRVLGTHPEWGTEIAAKAGRYGPYVTEVLPEGATEKPRTASLFQSMSPETVTLEDAVRLLSLPRVLGADPADGVEVTAQNGRYGPYVKKDTESRSLEGEEQLFTISLEDALALLAKPKERRGRGQAKPPLRELGADPVSSKPVVLKEGRFGPYVTDGETNASLRRGDDPETVTIERAAELLADRRSKGPAPKRKRGGGKRSAA